MRTASTLAAVWLLLLVGCATDPGAKIARHEIKTVGVDPRVNASRIRFGEDLHTRQANADLDAWVVDAMKGKKMARMATVMQANKIDVPSMVRSNFVQAVHEIGYEYSENRPDATFVLELEQHGFDHRTQFSGYVAPFAVVRAKLMAVDGKVIWRANSQLNAKRLMLGRLADYTDESRKQIGVKEWEDYERNPEKLRQDWEMVARNAVQKLLRAAQKAKAG
jgi:hypothetical protein